MCSLGIGGVTEKKDQLGALAPSQSDAIAMLQRALGDRLAIHECAGPGAAIPQDVRAVFPKADLRVLPRNVDLNRTHITLGPTPELEHRLVDEHHPASERAVDLEPRMRTRRDVAGAHRGCAFRAPRPKSRFR